ncbi:MAG: hypothetical protein ACJAYU_004562 [Bradymonadia bacterium]
MVVIEACELEVALFRRDVLAATEPELLGRCTLPCIDTPGPGFFAYATAVVTAEGTGPPSIETFVNVE